MKKALFYAYAFFAVIVLPVVIGGGSADYLMGFYDNFSHHWIAGAVVCFLSGAVVSWFPMLFLI